MAESRFDEAIRFVSALFQPDDFIELRLLETWDETGDRGGSPARSDPKKPKKESKLHERKWIKPSEFPKYCERIEKLNGKPTWANAFFGVCPRAKGKGDKAAISVIRCLWADLDHCTPDEAIQRIEKAGLQAPSIVVASGHGTHLYWTLSQPWHVKSEGDRMKAELTTREMSRLIGGDHTHDCTRILRLPGFANVKNARNGAVATACILFSFNLACGFDSLEEAISRLPEESQQRVDGAGQERHVVRPAEYARGSDIVTRALKYLDKMPAAISGQGGSRDTFKAALAMVHGFGLDPAVALDLLSKHYNPRCNPPWSEKDLRRKVDQVASKPHDMPFGWLRNAANQASGRSSRPPIVDDSDYERSVVSGQQSEVRNDQGVGEGHAGGTGGGGDNGNGDGGAGGFHFPPPPKTGPAPANRDPGSYALTDLGNAKRYLDTYGKIVRYSETHGILCFDGRRWEEQAKARAHGLAILCIEAMKAEVQKLEKPPEGAAYQANADKAKSLQAWMRKSEQSNRTEAIMTQGRGVAVNKGLFIGKNEVDDIFDAHPLLLNVPNGMIDLRTGRLLPHKREAYQTLICPVAYDSAAKCPTWLNFLHQSLKPDMMANGYVQRVCGYLITGSVQEHAFFFSYGKPGSGKSTLSETTSAMLGEYSRAIASETLMVQHGSQIPNDIAALRGARLVTTNEVEEGKRLAESKVSEYTGGDKIAARFMRAEWFEFKPRFKLWMRGNSKPAVRNPNSGIWRRLHVWEFPNVVPNDRQDKKLPQKLLAELPGILAWSVEGVRMWLRDGLKPPGSVLSATQQYQEESDTVGRWREECTLQDEAYAEAGSVLYHSYVRFCMATNIRPLSNNIFAERLGEMGFVKDKSLGQSMWAGLQLTEDSRKAINAHSPNYKFPW